jgi:hypothetical protein
VQFGKKARAQCCCCGQAAAYCASSDGEALALRCMAEAAADGGSPLLHEGSDTSSGETIESLLSRVAEDFLPLHECAAAVPSPPQSPRAADDKEPPSPSQWPDRPLLLRAGRGHGSNRGATMRLNTPVAIETESFRGHALFRLPHHPGTEQYWANSGSGSRANSVVIQGQFTRRVPFSDVYTGQQWAEPLQIDHLKGVRLGIEVVRRVSPLLQANVAGGSGSGSADTEADSRESTHFLSPLAPTAKRMHVCMPGSPDAPVLGPGVIVEEHTRLLGGRFARAKEGKSLPHKKRRSYFNSTKALAKYSFEPGLLYTFDFFSANPSFTDFELKMLGKTVDLASVLNGQPIQFMAKIVPPPLSSTASQAEAAATPLQQQQQQRWQQQQECYLWQLEVLHESQFQDDTRENGSPVGCTAGACEERADLASGRLGGEDPSIEDHRQIDGGPHDGGGGGGGVFEAQGMWTEVLQHRLQRSGGSSPSTAGTGLPEERAVEQVASGAPEPADKLAD